MKVAMVMAETMMIDHSLSWKHLEVEEEIDRTDESQIWNNTLSSQRDKILF